MRHSISAEEVLSELRSFFDHHPVAQNKSIDFQENPPDVTFNTDISLLLRILCNMALNALEATKKNGRVKIWTEHEGDSLSFFVWNSQDISKEIAIRIFQRNFSTKGQAGRGIGTFSMKLFGEKILGGQVTFTTSKEDGTVFRFALPL
jgi:sensor histidine kinase regulating citrate/malate metabolism